MSQSKRPRLRSGTESRSREIQVELWVIVDENNKDECFGLFGLEKNAVDTALVTRWRQISPSTSPN